MQRIIMLRLLTLLAVARMAWSCAPSGTAPIMPPDDMEDHKDKDNMMMKKTFLFAVEGAWEPYSYQDSSGYVSGFLPDMIMGVCNMCGMDCDTVFIDTNLDRCWQPDTIQAPGLMDRHFDACAGWAPTVARMNVLNFTKGFLMSPMARMYVRPTTTDINNIDDITGRAFGFRASWYMDKFCARRAGVTVNDEDVNAISITTGWQDIIDALTDKQVDIILVPDGVAGSENLTPLGDPVMCSNDGYGLMMRKDSVDMGWWDDCMGDMMMSQAWMDTCSKWGVSDKCMMSSTMPQDDKDDDDMMMKKTFLFALEGAWEPYSYQDSSGYVSGFLPDMINGVCNMCGMDCDTVFIGTNLDRCWQPDTIQAPGLMDRHFDACVGWAPTVARTNVLNFTKGFLTSPMARMYIRPTTTDINSIDDITGRAFGFRASWYMDKFCARRAGVTVNDTDVNAISITTGWQDVIDALTDKQVDIILVPDGVAGSEDLVPLGDPVMCTNDGYGLMTRKDSRMDMGWWDDCMGDMMMSQAWMDTCRKWGVSDKCMKPSPTMPKPEAF